MFRVTGIGVSGGGECNDTNREFTKIRRRKKESRWTSYV